MAKSSTGIYIGKNGVDVVVFSGKPNKPVLLEHVRKEIKFEHYEIYSTEEKINKKTAEAINSAISELKVKPEEVFFGLSETGIMLRCFDMPLLPRSEQTQAIRFEARKYIPFKIEDVFFDFKIVNVSKDKKRMHVLFVAAQKVHIEAQLNLFKNIGVKVVGIDIAPSALLKALNASKQVLNKDEIIALLQLSTAEDIASISIIESKYPTMSRDITVTQDKDALAEKLISELTLSFDYYKRRGAGGEIKKLIICGKDNSDGLAKKLSEELNIAVEILEPSGAIEGMKFDSVSAMIAAGVAINGLGIDTHGIDLLPEHTRTRGFTADRQLVLVGTAAVSLILVTALYSIGIVSVAAAHLKKVVAQGKTLPAITQYLDTATLENLKNEELKIITTLRSSVDQRIYLTDKLNAINTSLPKGAWITAMDAKNLIESKMQLIINGNVFLKDSTQQIDTATQFLKNLKQNKVFMEGFNRCKLGNIKKDKIDAYEVTSYSIDCGGRKE